MALRVGTRGSKLALAQTGQVVDALIARHPGADVETIVVKTDDAGSDDKSRYVGNIERALLTGEIDLAVHSAKDLPGEEVEGLKIAAVPPRADARDLLCGANSLAELPDRARVGTSSLRRAAQLACLRADIVVEPLHGNIDTRLARLDAGEYEAIVLAAAGLDRLRISEGRLRSPLEQMVPAPGQGCLVLQTRSDGRGSGGEDVEGWVRKLSDRSAEAALVAERAAAAALGASCNTPLGVFATLAPAVSGGGEEITVHGWLGLPDGSAYVEDSISGPVRDCERLGRTLAERMRRAGGNAILDQLGEVPE